MARRNNGGCIGALIMLLFWILNKLIECIVESLEDKSPNVIRKVNTFLLIVFVLEIIICAYVLSELGWN